MIVKRPLSGIATRQLQLTDNSEWLFNIPSPSEIAVSKYGR